MRSHVIKSENKTNRIIFNNRQLTHNKTKSFCFNLKKKYLINILENTEFF
jgi:hypothetical protein